MIKIKKIFDCCFVIIGTIIGAGFISGQEIYSFFCIYGFKGLIGIVFSSIFISLIIYIILNLVLKNNINSYNDFSSFLIGKKNTISYSINNIMNVFLLISFVVMVAGFGSFFKQEFNISNIIGSLFICFLSIICFFKNINGLVKINLIFVPIILICVFLLFYKSDFSLFSFKNLYLYNNINWLLKSLLYASYNSIILIPILINLKQFINNKKQIYFISLFSFIIIIITSLIIYFVLSVYIKNLKQIDIPIIYIATNFGLFYKYLYSLIILMAIFTTAISAGFSFINNVSKNKKQYTFFSFFICIISIICSNIGFAKLLNTLYPVLGFLGFGEIILIMRKQIKDLKYK